MRKEQIKITNVYEINGRLVVAESIEQAIETWKCWMGVCHDVEAVRLVMTDNGFDAPNKYALIYSSEDYLAVKCAELEAHLKAAEAELYDLRKLTAAAGK